MVLLFALLINPSEARRFALLVGNNLGSEDLDTLRFAQSDASHMAEVLQSVAGFDAQDIQVVAPCDSLTLETAFKSIKAKMNIPGNMDGMFLFYYSGHSDRDGLVLGSKRYPLQLLHDHLQSIPGQIKIGIFDACQSGAMTRFKGGRTAKPISLESLKNIQGQIIIASSAADEASQESEKLQSSVFTHHWINGLRGSADISGDQKVTLTEAYQYAYQMTILTTSRTRFGIQHPAYQFRIQGEGDIVMADLNLKKAGINFPSSVEGKYLVVERERGNIVADFYKPIGNPLLINLGNGGYQVLKVERNNWLLANEEVRSDRVVEFQSGDLMSRPNIVNPIKGSMDTSYKVLEGPLKIRTQFPGASKQFGLSLKFGESAGFVGLAYLYNLGPEMQLQGGGGFSTSQVTSDSGTSGNQDRCGNFFALLRQYQGPYFVDAGLNLKTDFLSVQDPSGSGSGYGWEMGVPVHVGIELGPRQSFFVTMSLGYLWVFTGGGDLVKAYTPAHLLGYTHTVESGMSAGVALGAYIF